MALTTERLREIAERRSPSLRWGEAEQIAAELLANREAQPVAASALRDSARYQFLRNKDTWGCDNEPSLVEWDDLIDLEGSEFDAAIDARIANSDVDYAAPPAPVVNPEFTGATAVPDGYCMMPLTLTAENGAKAVLSGEFSTTRVVICPECDGDGCSDCDGRGDWYESQSIEWITVKEIYRRAVEVCAMLAQPVSQGYKLPDGWVACSERLPDTDGNYWGWWSESKRQGPVWFIKSDVQAQFQSSEITHWMPLPAAPATAPDEIEPDSIDKFVAQVCGDLTTSNRK
ncbi:DUF551 domain-containing protein [Serratia liquefaciens]|uniref:DUF551 domain-containing protein n=1 Tax=Serratia liquefaciens TaxID=614 RepID=UPI0021842DE7|nr:DUF551 domain-containing protein [Serratia liquefaciens]CAI2470448.1 Protein of uncharacterised function (DUF551) [Serratia liquefaciens]